MPSDGIDVNHHRNQQPLSTHSRHTRSDGVVIAAAQPTRARTSSWRCRAWTFRSAPARPRFGSKWAGCPETISACLRALYVPVEEEQYAVSSVVGIFTRKRSVVVGRKDSRRADEVCVCMCVNTKMTFDHRPIAPRVCIIHTYIYIQACWDKLPPEDIIFNSELFVIFTA